LKVQVDSLHQQLADEKRKHGLEKDQRQAIHAEHALALEKINELEQQLQAEFAKRVVATDHSHQEFLTLKSQIEDLKFGVRLTNALAKLNRYFSLDSLL